MIRTLAFNHSSRVKAQRGQTLVIALIVLGVLLILGFVFLGIVDRSIKNSGTAGRRSLSADYARAGVQYAHSQLLNSQLGADWRGQPSYFYVDNTPASSADPDLYYMRPGTGYPLPANPNLNDLGGPDGLGPFIRLNFANGRALVRVRLAPSDFNVLTTSPVGPLRYPGQARDYLIIEAIGRDGVVNPKDPTTANRGGGIQYSGYGGSLAAYEQNLALMAQADGQLATSQKVTAMQAIGITDYAYFITNKDRVNRPAEIGIPSDLGASSAHFDPTTGATVKYSVGSNPNFQTARDPSVGGIGLVTELGGRSYGLLNANGTQPGFPIAANGPIMSNASLVLYGNTSIALNQSLGQTLSCDGTITPDNGAQLIVDRSYQDSAGNWVNPAPVTLTGATLDSRSAAFNTDFGAIRDGVAVADVSGFTRGVGRLEPPSIESVDPQTNQNRYIESTMNSGVLINGDNSGRYGHGSGVYVDNVGDVQEPPDEASRQNVGDSQSLVYDWLNPNNTQMTTTGWKGPFYAPVGASLEFREDGFTITRDDGYWRDAKGAQTTTQTNRYRLGRASDNSLRILDQITFSGDINSGSLTPADFDNGLPFDGILYFAGNVRVKGIIPTDIQVTVVSNATIYIDGSITKGVKGTEWTQSRPANVPGAAGIDYHLPAVQIDARITYPPLATLMLAAKDYVAVNTTMFLAPQGPLNPDPVTSADQSYAPIRMTASQALDFRFEMPLQNTPSVADPNIDPNNPSTWESPLTSYLDAVNTNQQIAPALMLVHTMADESAGSMTAISMWMNSASAGQDPTKQYYFPTSTPEFLGTTEFNSFAPIWDSYTPAQQAMFANSASNLSVWGLGSEAWQTYPSFEADFFPIVAPGPASNLSADQILGYGPSFSTAQSGSQYTFQTQAPNDIYVQPASVTGLPWNDYLLAKAAIVPSDVRIEASIYAEEGSFFVIPGPYFNTNPSDRHDTFGSLSNNLADLPIDRMQLYGSSPRFPFYGEPPDIKISIVGAISMNMPAPMSEQAEWLRKWGWIPVQQGCSTVHIADTHVPAANAVVSYDPNLDYYVPNLTVSYDPVLATANTTGYANSGPAFATRVDQYGRVLSPIPRLPVSPSLAYFGDQG